MKGSALLLALGAAACSKASPQIAPPPAPPKVEAAIVADSTDAPLRSFDVRTRGAELTELLYRGADAEIWAQTSPTLRAALGGKRGWSTTRSSLEQKLGPEVEVLREDIVDNSVVRAYWRLVRFENLPVPLHVMWTFNSSDQVSGFAVKPEQKEAASRFLSYSPLTQLSLPFRDTFFVFWGGRDVMQNYHAASKDQRFAYDFLVVEGGKTHRGAGLENTDYFCYGKPVIAPAPGIVALAGDGVEENVPGEMNADDVLGNFVIIDHENGEFSFLAHLRTGTVSVQEGDKVETGTFLGECGNSGHSSEPHLHYHLQNSSQLFRGEGLPPLFRDYQQGDQHVQLGEPVQGQSVTPMLSHHPEGVDDEGTQDADGEQEVSDHPAPSPLP